MYYRVYYKEYIIKVYVYVSTTESTIVCFSFITPFSSLPSAQAALKITRTALNMFTVTNRRDMYVFQDVKQSGEETIFYLK